MQRHIALEFDGADLEGSSRNQHGSASIVMARINRRLQCGRVERNSVPFRAILANVVDASAIAVCSWIAFCLPGCESSLSRRTTEK